MSVVWGTQRARETRVGESGGGFGEDGKGVVGAMWVRERAESSGVM